MADDNRDIRLGLVCREYGHRAVRFALAIDPDASLTGIYWTPAREQALAALEGGLMVAVLDQEGVLRQSRNAVFGYFTAHDDSILRALRSVSGGAVPPIDAGISESADALTRHLQRLINRYEEDILAITSNVDRYRTGWVPSLHGDPDGRALMELIVDHEKAAPLQRALSDSPDQARGLRGCILVTPSTASTFQELTIPEDLLRACIARALIEGGPLTADSLRPHAEPVIDDFLALAAGTPTEVPIAVGAVGSQLAGTAPDSRPRGSLRGDRLPAGDGHLRPVAPQDELLFSMATDPIGLVWVTVEPAQIRFLPVGDSSAVDDAVKSTRKEMAEDSGRLDERWKVVAQAVVLAAPNYPPPSWTASEFHKATPVGRQEYSYRGRALAAGELSATRVTIAELGNVAHWHELLSKHPDTLNISRRRVLSAITIRSDPVDALVDAVVAWEGIFSGTPETQMRTVLPACKLIAQESEAPETLKSMKDVYGLRSKLVHGSASAKITDRDIRDARDQALRWVISLLKHVYAKQPELLPLSASARSEAVLVPGSHPTS